MTARVPAIACALNFPADVPVRIKEPPIFRNWPDACPTPRAGQPESEGGRRHNLAGRGDFAGSSLLPPSPRPQRRVVFRRLVGVDHQVERRLRRAIDVDAAAAQFSQGGADGFVLRSARMRRCVGGRSGRRRRRRAAHRLQPRHLQHFQRLHQPVEIDAGRLPRVRARARSASARSRSASRRSLSFCAGARRAARVSVARGANGGRCQPPSRVQRQMLARPTPVLARSRHRSAWSVRSGGAPARDLGVGMRPARAARPRADDRRRPVLGRVGRDAETDDDGIEGKAHDADNNPIARRAQGGGRGGHEPGTRRQARPQAFIYLLRPW